MSGNKYRSIITLYGVQLSLGLVINADEAVDFVTITYLLARQVDLSQSFELDSYINRLLHSSFVQTVLL